MKIGDIYTAPWGRYSVHRVGAPIVLRSLERTNAFIVNPGADYVATGETMLVGSDVVHRRADPENGQIRGGVERPGRLAATIDEVVEKQDSATSHGAAGKTVDASESSGALDIGAAIAAVHAIAIVTPDRPTLGGVRPGCARGGWGPSWIPCLTRSRDDFDQPMASEHCWFLSFGSLFCEACFATRPRVVVGPTAIIAAIRTAVGAGDKVLLARLLQRLERDGGVDPCHHELAPDAGDHADIGLSRGHGGSQPAVESPRVHPARLDSDEAKEVVPPTISPPPTRADDPKESVGSFARVVHFVPKDLADWQEFFSERAAINQYLFWALVPK